MRNEWIGVQPRRRERPRPTAVGCNGCNECGASHLCDDLSGHERNEDAALRQIVQSLSEPIDDKNTDLS
jgi:hypothetical protein